MDSMDLDNDMDIDFDLVPDEPIVPEPELVCFATFAYRILYPMLIVART
jgi:hypothetical protein